MNGAPGTFFDPLDSLNSKERIEVINNSGGLVTFTIKVTVDGDQSTLGPFPLANNTGVFKTVDETIAATDNQHFIEAEVIVKDLGGNIVGHGVNIHGYTRSMPGGV